jgi:hypothetical protein
VSLVQVMGISHKCIVLSPVFPHDDFHNHHGLVSCVLPLSLRICRDKSCCFIIYADENGIAFAVLIERSFWGYADALNANEIVHDKRLQD